MATSYFPRGLNVRMSQASSPIATGGGPVCWVVESTRFTLAVAETKAEAEAAREAILSASLPRFTRDHAIDLARAAVSRLAAQGPGACTAMGVARAILFALGTAGVFSDGRNMAERLDAAGFR